MNFHDKLNMDIGRTFLDADFFAEDHEVEGRVISCVLDGGTEAPKSGVIPLNGYDVTLYAKTCDVGSNLSAGMSINVDGREMFVVERRINAGIVELQLSQNQGGVNYDDYR